MQIIPLTSTASQTLTVVLNKQNCRINVYTLSTGLYLDLYLEGKRIIGAIICRNRVRIVRQAYLGFVGNLAFVDTQGNDDPIFSGLGSRFLLTYLEADE